MIAHDHISTLIQNLADCRSIVVTPVHQDKISRINGQAPQALSSVRVGEFKKVAAHFRQPKAVVYTPVRARGTRFLNVRRIKNANLAVQIPAIPRAIKPRTNFLKQV